MKVNRATVELIAGSSPIADKPMHVNEGSPEEQAGSVQKFRIRTTDDLDFIFGLVTWPSARPEVRAIEMLEGLSKYERLVNAGRLSLIPVDQDHWLAEINVMKFNGRDRQTLNRPTSDELNFLAGGDAEKLLIDMGVIKIGTRELLVGDTSTKRNALAVIVEAGDVKAVAATFALTRVMAVMYELGLNND